MFSKTLRFKSWVALLSLGLIANGYAYAGTAGSPSQAPQAQSDATGTLTGTVLDAEGEPLTGATIRVDGTTLATAADIDGKFSIAGVKKGSKVTATFIGYTPATLEWNGQPLEFTLSDNNLLDEVVVVGYGVQKKANVSGAVSQVKMDEVLGDRPVANAANALQGTMPGLRIAANSNTPGSTDNFIQVRGTASLNASGSAVYIGALVLIDNVPGDLNALNPNDIESVTILKDASASAIYGARAAAGVVLVTTKRPKAQDKVTVNYNNNFGWNRAINLPKQERLDVYLPIWKEAFGNSYAANAQNVDSWLEYLNMYNNNPSQLSSLGTLYEDTGIFVANADGKRYYMKQDDIYGRMMETGFTMNHNLSISGGNDNISFRMSGNFYDENGPFYGNKDKFRRLTINAAISAKIFNWWTQEADIQYSQRKRDQLVAEYGYLYSTRLQNFLPDGYDPLGYRIGTPRAIIDLGNPYHQNTDLPRIFIKSIFRPIKGLEAIFEYTYSKSSVDYNYFSGQYTVSTIQEGPGLYPANDYYVARWNKTSRNTINAYATYRFDIKQLHNFSVMAGYNQELEDYVYYNVNAQDQNLIDVPSLSGAGGKVVPTDSYYQFATRSGFFRLNYNYDQRYMLEVSGRYDGSSKFPKKKRYGFFPSFSVAWNAAQEPWWQGLNKWISELKPRFSYGSIGNQISAGYYGYIETYGYSTTGTAWLNGLAEGYVGQLTPPGQMISGNYTWETIYTTNVGLDFRAFQNKLTGSFEWYQRDTKDILSESVQLPSVLGATAPLQNVGSLRTRGWELEMNWQQRLGADWRYSLGFNLTDYTTKITKLNFNEGKSLGSLYEGYEIGQTWGYLWDGFYTVDDFEDLGTWKLKEGVPTIQGYTPQPGDYKFKNIADYQTNDNDVNQINPGLSTLDKPGDRVIVGNTAPHYLYGFNLGVGWKGLDLSAFFQGVGRQDLFNTGELFYTFSNTSDPQWYPVYAGTTNYWQPKSTNPESPDYMVAANPNAEMPRIYGNKGNYGSNLRASDKTKTSGAYLRLKNVTLSYSFPQQLMRKIYIQNLRLFCTVENLATWSSLPNGFDPETRGYAYPQRRTISTGLNIIF
ncbi:MAG: TonB-dependent receptor [Paramuribaculum sp.]|nr:TonB-dependent receptor [Paramuribaculum sp.]